MSIGPIQLVVIGFESNERFKGDIMRELDALRGRGVIRVLDLLFVMKDEDGEIFAFEDTDLSDEEEAEYGVLINAMIGLGEGQDAETAVSEALAVSHNDYGLTEEDIRQVADKIEPGTSAGILMVEHVWAAGFKEAVAEAGGQMLAQGFLTPEALFMVGAELQAIVEAEAAIEVAEAVKGAAMLDALATVAEAGEIADAALDEAAEAVAAAEMVKTAAAAEAVRALIVAGLIEDAAAHEAIEALVAAEIIEEAAFEEAQDAVAQAEAVVEEAFAAAERASDDDDGTAAQPEAA
jgi:uncharacterized membrane protein